MKDKTKINYNQAEKGYKYRDKINVKLSEYMYVDVHSHCFLIPNEYNNIVNSAISNRLIFIENGLDIESNKIIVEKVNYYFNNRIYNVRGALGLYPIKALKLDTAAIDKVIKFIKSKIIRYPDRFIAIGEVGLDYKEDIMYHEKQQQALVKLLKLASHLNKPIILHSRKAEKDVIDLTEDYYKQRIKQRFGSKKNLSNTSKVIMHCFSGNLKLIKRVIDNGWYLTVTANINKSKRSTRIARICPIEQLITETDSPFLSPDNSTNKPTNVIKSVNKIAELRSLDPEIVRSKIIENFYNLFS